MSGRKRGARDRLSLGDRNGRACFSSPSVSMGRFEAHDRDRRGSVVVGCASSSKHEWGGASSQWIGRLDMKAKRSISCHVPKTVHFNIGVSPGRSEALGTPQHISHIQEMGRAGTHFGIIPHSRHSRYHTAFT
eukprot:Polyplicarium_translucidae@DN856_c0_g1_i2.p1